MFFSLLHMSYEKGNKSSKGNINRLADNVWYVLSTRVDFILSTFIVKYIFEERWKLFISDVLLSFCDVYRAYILNWIQQIYLYSYKSSNPSILIFKESDRRIDITNTMNFQIIGISKQSIGNIISKPSSCFCLSSMKRKERFCLYLEIITSNLISKNRK